MRLCEFRTGFGKSLVSDRPMSVIVTVLGDPAGIQFGGLAEDAVFVEPGSLTAAVEKSAPPKSGQKISA